MKRRTTVVVSAEVDSVPDFYEETTMKIPLEVEIVVPFMKNPEEEINLGIKLNVLKLLKLKIAPEDL